MPRILDISDGYSSASEPTKGELQATSIVQYADDAAFVAGKGSAAGKKQLFKRLSKYNKDVTQLVKDMNKYKQRVGLKKLLGRATGAGLIGYGSYRVLDNIMGGMGGN